jgi:hypothetical protein
MIVVGYEVDQAGRYPSKDKVAKILDWPECRTVKEVRQFTGLAVYYRQWIFCFSLKAEPLFRPLRKEAEWAWGEEQREAMRSFPSLACMCNIFYPPGPSHVSSNRSPFLQETQQVVVCPLLSIALRLPKVQQDPVPTTGCPFALRAEVDPLKWR